MECSTPSHLIDDIFVLTGNIGGQYWGKGSEGRGEWLQEPEGRRWRGQRSRGEEQVWRRGDEQHDGWGKEDDRGDEDKGAIGAQATDQKGPLAGEQ